MPGVWDRDWAQTGMVVWEGGQSSRCLNVPV